ncbi:protein FAM200A [Trichonephila clavipes]|nr:protein FAM200A [Trichonephila clavipes]
MSLTWENCVAVCTDGAAALTGSSKGFRGLIKKVTPHTVFNPCMIHRQALVAKDMDEELHNILHKTLLVQLTTLNATVLTEPSLFNTLQSDGLNGENSTIITSASKIPAFKNKLSLWQTEQNKNNTDMFPCFNDFIKENNIDMFTFKNTISNHIEKLKENFSRRFEDFPEKNLGWIRDPFPYDICSSTL